MEHFSDESDGFTGCATHPGIEWELISLKRARVITRSTVKNTRVVDFPGHTLYCGMCEDTPKVRLDSK